MWNGGFGVLELLISFNYLEEVLCNMISKRQTLKQSVAMYENIAISGEVWLTILRKAYSFLCIDVRVQSSYSPH